MRGVRGRGAGGKTVVFGLIKRKGKVYTQVVKNCSVKELVPIIRKRVGIDSVIYTDGFKTYVVFREFWLQEACSHPSLQK